jgi:RES domain-containing protein
MASWSDDPDQISKLYTAIDELGASPLSVRAFRHTSPGRDPLSGVGARLLGARWNPRDGAATVYLAEPIEACIAEFFRMAEGQGRGVESFLPRDLHTLELDAIEVVDLTAQDGLAAVGLSQDDVMADDWDRCQGVGAAIELLGYAGLCARSATSLGRVIALFESRIDPKRVRLVETRALVDYL